MINKEKNMPNLNCKAESHDLQVFLERYATEVGQASRFVQRTS